MKFLTHAKLHKKNGNVMMRLASVLFMLVLTSTCILAGLLARYTVISSAEDSARVAGFSVLAVNDTEDSSMTIDLGSTQPLAVYALALTNQSEVAVSYGVVVELEKKLPEGMKVYLANDKEGTSPMDVTAVQQDGLLGEKYKFSDAGQMEPVSETEKYLIFAPVPDAAAGAMVYDHLDDNDDDDTTYSNDIDFKVKIQFVQVD